MLHGQTYDVRAKESASELAAQVGMTNLERNAPLAAELHQARVFSKREAVADTLCAEQDGVKQVVIRAIAVPERLACVKAEWHVEADFLLSVLEPQQGWQVVLEWVEGVLVANEVEAYKRKGGRASDTAPSRQVGAIRTLDQVRELRLESKTVFQRLPECVIVNEADGRVDDGGAPESVCPALCCELPLHILNNLAVDADPVGMAEDVITGSVGHRPSE